MMATLTGLEVPKTVKSRYLRMRGRMQGLLNLLGIMFNTQVLRTSSGYFGFVVSIFVLHARVYAIIFLSDSNLPS